MTANRRDEIEHLVARALETAPPLTPERRARITRLLAPSAWIKAA